MPANSPLDQLLRCTANPEALLVLIAMPGFVRSEQWQAQIQAVIQRRADVLVRSSLSDEIIRAAHLTPCHDIAAVVREKLADLGPAARVAFLPQGPLTIPYLA